MKDNDDRVGHYIFSPVVLGLAIALALGLTALAAHAAAPARKTYNIPPAPLAQALNQFSQEAGISLSFDPALAEGKQSAGLGGEYAIEEGLRALLAGTGISYRFTGEHTVTLEKSTEGGAIQLPLTTVEAEKVEGVGYASGVSSAATRLPEPILDTPRSVNVVPESVLEDRAIFDPQEAVQNVSGVQRGPSRTGVGESYLIRGFTQQSLFKDGFRAGQSPASGEPFTFEGPTDVANLERIEVLKGPSALLYGRGEPGGTINYITRVPDFENRFSLRQHFGNFDFYRTELHVNGALSSGTTASERVAARLDAAYQTNESFIDFVGAERFFVAPSLRWRIGPETSLTLRGEYANDDHSTSLGFPVVNGKVLDAPYDRYFGEPGFTEIESETWRGLATLDHRWNENHATTVSLHGARSTSEGGNFILFNFAGPLQDPVTGDIARAAEDVDFRSKYFTARLDHLWEATLYDDARSEDVGRAGGWRFPAVTNQLLASFEFDRQTVDGTRVLSGHSPLNPFRPVYTGYAPRPLIPDFPVQFGDDSSVEAEATSLLLLNRLSFGERVMLSFGGRYEWFDASSKTTFFPSGLPFPNSNNKMDEETFNPSAGLLVKPLDSLSVYGSYAESTSSFQNIGLTTVTGDPLDEERSRQFEVGAKLELLDGRLFATTALFQIDKSDVAGTDPDNPFFSINGGDERSRGIEFDIGGEPLPGWRLTANYAYIDAEITDDPTGVTTGNRRGGVPEHSGGFFTTYELQDGPLQGFGGGVGLFVSDSVELDDIGTAKLSGWEQVDGVVFYRRKNWVAQLNIKNLLDEEFFYTSSVFEVSEVQRAPGRTVIASVSYRF